jgi:hypothetical protein
LSITYKARGIESPAKAKINFAFPKFFLRMIVVLVGGAVPVGYRGFPRPGATAPMAATAAA